MKAIFVCDDNPVYREFWEPQASFLWQAFGLRSRLYFLSNDPSLQMFESPYAEVRRIPLSPSLPAIVQALFAKWYFPALEAESERVCIFDIDCFLLSKTFLSTVHSGTRLFHLALQDDRLPGYYVAGTPAQLRSFFRVGDLSFDAFCQRALEECPIRIEAAHASSYSKAATTEWMYFETEERYAAKCAALCSEPVDGSTPAPDPAQSQRICRSWKCWYYPHVFDGYVDFHCPRPYSDYRHIIDPILRRVLQKRSR